MKLHFPLACARFLHTGFVFCWPARGFYTLASFAAGLRAVSTHWLRFLLACAQFLHTGFIFCVSWNMLEYEWNMLEYEWNMLEYRLNILEYRWNMLENEWNMLEYRWNMLECEWNVLAYLSQDFLLCNLGHSTSQQPQRLHHIQNAQKSIAAVLLAFRIDKRITLVFKNVLRRCMICFSVLRHLGRPSPTFDNMAWA